MSARGEPQRRGRLNLFQRGMLQWNDLCPYNAVHVVRIPSPLNTPRLEETVRKVLAAHGIGDVIFDRKRGWFRFDPQPPQWEFRRIDGDGAFESLSSEIERQLNQPFPGRGKFLPLRFFYAGDEKMSSLGLVYFHPIADAESVVMLLKDIAMAYVSEKVEVKPFDLYPPRRDRPWNGGLAVLARKLAAGPGIWRRMNVSDRFPCKDARNFQLGFTFFSLDAAALQKLSASAKAFGVTINDMFLAILLKCVSPFAAARVKNSKRRSISVGCIVNVRRDLELPNPKTFGLFLGSFSVTHEVPDGISLEQLARDISIQTRRIKRQKLCLGMPIQMAIGNLFLSRFSLKFRQKFYAKQYPLYGGITNMNLNALWPEPLGGEPVCYFRAVSTGPVTPLVFSISTAGKVLNIGLSHRTIVFSKQAIERVRADFTRYIKELPGA